MPLHRGIPAEIPQSLSGNHGGSCTKFGIEIPHWHGTGLARFPLELISIRQRDFLPNRRLERLRRSGQSFAVCGERLRG